MGQPERSASSTRRRPSTPTYPFSVGRPPRRAMRNSFSQRLSRLVRSAGSLAVRALRAALPGVAITVEGSKFLAGDANAGMLRLPVSFPNKRNIQTGGFLTSAPSLGEEAPRVQEWSNLWVAVLRGGGW